MKKKLFILVLAASICGSVLLSGDAFADVSQCIYGTNPTPTKLCAGSVFRANRNACAENSDETTCRNYIKSFLIFNQGSMSSSAKEQLRNTYINNVYNIIHTQNVDPCYSWREQAESYQACKSLSGNWEYYEATAPGSTPTPSGGGGGGGGSSPSSPDSGDDNGSSTEPIDPSPVSEGACTSILPNDWCTGDDGIQQIIRLIIAILTGSIVVAGTIGLVICGVLWMTARENEQQVTTAKKRMLDIVIGVVAWVLLALLANLFIPKPSSEIDGTSVVTSKEKIV